MDNTQLHKAMGRGRWLGAHCVAEVQIYRLYIPAPKDLSIDILIRFFHCTIQFFLVLGRG